MIKIIRNYELGITNYDETKFYIAISFINVLFIL